MRSIFLFLFALVQFVSVAQAQMDHVNLFDGKSLTGWEYFLVEPDVS
ncbi:MAG: hypothetical protein HOG34_01995, partial [Bacteroidetes bacterium]|nr:hypothetical protein [Bacteroidota bacterium]